MRRSRTERTCGAHGRENAGMSNARQVRILPIESLRFPGRGLSTQGKSGPKPRTESRRRWTAGRYSRTTNARLTEAVTRKDRGSRVMDSPAQA